jgi:hypothetical protein
MDEYIGLDVSMKETAVSIRRNGKRIWRGKCASDPASIGALLRKHAPSAKRVIFETGPLSVWFYHALCAQGLPAICIDARHAKAALDMAANKTDANDADCTGPQKSEAIIFGPAIAGARHSSVSNLGRTHTTTAISSDDRGGSVRQVLACRRWQHRDGSPVSPRFACRASRARPLARSPAPLCRSRLAAFGHLRRADTRR